MASLNVNGTVREFEADPDTPLLWVLREQLGLTGTKYGCGVAQCGACTVHIDGVPTRSCVRPASTVSVDREDRHHRRAFAQRLASGAESVGGARRSAMRVLPGRHDHGGRGAAQDDAQSQRRADQRVDHQHLPVRHLQPRARRDQGRRARGRCQERRTRDPACRGAHIMTHRSRAPPLPRHVGCRCRQSGRRLSDSVRGRRGRARCDGARCGQA